MIDGLGLPQVGLGSGWAAFLVVCLMFPLGRAYSRRQVDDIIHDRDEWRAESRIKDTQLQEKDEQLRHMVEVGRTVERIMRAVQQGATQPEESS